MIVLFALPLSGYLFFQLYLGWPALFPKYPIGSCVEDTKVQRIHQITGNEDRLKGSGVPTKILVVGQSVPGAFSVGMEASISLDDSDIKLVPCPK